MINYWSERTCENFIPEEGRHAMWRERGGIQYYFSFHNLRLWKPWLEKILRTIMYQIKSLYILLAPFISFSSLPTFLLTHPVFPFLLLRRRSPFRWVSEKKVFAVFTFKQFHLLSLSDHFAVSRKREREKMIPQERKCQTNVTCDTWQDDVTCGKGGKREAIFFLSPLPGNE